MVWPWTSPAATHLKILEALWIHWRPRVAPRLVSGSPLPRYRRRQNNGCHPDFSFRRLVAEFKRYRNTG